MKFNILPPRLGYTAFSIAGLVSIFIISISYLTIPIAYAINYLIYFSLYWFYRGFSIRSTFKGNNKLERHVTSILGLEGAIERERVHEFILQAEFLNAFKSAGVNAVLVSSILTLLDHPFYVALITFIASCMTSYGIYWIARAKTPHEKGLDLKILRAAEGFNNYDSYQL